jgi:hypothetical protein
MAPRSILSAARAHYGDDECTHNVRQPTLMRRRGDTQEGLRARATPLTDDEAPQPARAPSWPYRPSQPQARPPQRLRSCSARSSALDSPPWTSQSNARGQAGSTTVAMSASRWREVGQEPRPGSLRASRHGTVLRVMSTPRCGPAPTTPGRGVSQTFITTVTAGRRGLWRGPWSQRRESIRSGSLSPPASSRSTESTQRPA